MNAKIEEIREKFERLMDIFATAIALVGMAAIAVLTMHVFN